MAAKPKGSPNPKGETLPNQNGEGNFLPQTRMSIAVDQIKSAKTKGGAEGRWTNTLLICKTKEALRLELENDFQGRTISRNCEEGEKKRRYLKMG